MTTIDLNGSQYAIWHDVRDMCDPCDLCDYINNCTHAHKYEDCPAGNISDTSYLKLVK